MQDEAKQEMLKYEKAAYIALWLEGAPNESEGVPLAPMSELEARAEARMEEIMALPKETQEFLYQQACQAGE